MTSDSLPSRIALWVKFGVVLVYSGVLSLFLAMLVDRPFWLVWISVLGLAIAGVTAALSWAHSWFMSSDGRVRQFRLVTLFYFTTTVAIYLAAIRWLFLAAQATYHSDAERPGQLIAFAVVAGILLLIAVFPLLSLAECVIWTAAWAVRRPLVRRLLIAAMRLAGRSQ
jgi:hypothetical protein